VQALEIVQETVQRAGPMNQLLQILQYLGPGMPPPYNARLDLNSDGFITVMDFLLALANL
jgi:hypothetical protein